MSNNDTSQQAPLTTLGRYRVIKRIGRGGMADVWLCEDPRLHRMVAIKTLPAYSQENSEYRLRFEREAQAAAALNHPHILPIHDYGEQPLSADQIMAYIVMPYISGGSLADRMNASNPTARLSPQESLTYLSQAAEAIDYAHQQGIIHRDIKPGNMLLRNDSWLLLADFGIARILSSTDNLTQTGVGFGTPEYMAPEQAQGRAVAASDNYSLAVIAYQIFTGRLPFIADTGYAITIQHMTEPPPPPRQLNPTLPPAFAEALVHGLAKQPEDRPPSAVAFVNELRRTLINATPFEATYSPPTPTRPQSGATPLTPVGARVQTPTTGGMGSTNMSTLLENEQAKVVASPISRRGFILGGSAALIAAGGGLGAWMLASKHNTSTLTTGQRATANSAPAATPAPDPNAPTFLMQRQHVQSVNALAWAPNQNVFASVADSDELILWDMQQLQQSPSSPQPKVKRSLKTGENMQLAWSPDGSKLAVANADGSANSLTQQTLVVFTGDLRSLAPGFSDPIVTGNTGVIYGVGWVQKNLLVTVSSHFTANINDNHFELWAMNTTPPQPTQRITLLPGVLGGSFSGHSQLLAVSPDGTTVAIVLTDGIAVGQVHLQGQTPVWKPVSANLAMPDVIDQPYGVAWSPSGAGIASYYAANTSTVFFWQWKNQNKKPSATLQTDKKLTAMSICSVPTSLLIATGADDGSVLIWNPIKTSIPVGTLNSGGINAQVQALAWSADGQWLAASFKDNDASIAIWKIQGRGF